MSVTKKILLEFIESLNAEELEFLCAKSGEVIAQKTRTGLKAAKPAAVAKLSPATVFSVPQDIKYLESEQLEKVTESFRVWYNQATRPDIRRARGRVWLVYLLLRYTGARLGEVLVLDEEKDFDLARAVVRLPEDDPHREAYREVQLPEWVMGELASYLAQFPDPAWRAAIFQLDQGYVRRKFYERARSLSLPHEMVNPRVIRHSRAIELLRSGAPLPVVQSILGHASINQTAQYCDFTAADVKRLITYYLQKEMQMKTSARNSFTGKVTNISTGTILSEVELTTPSGNQVLSVITNESLKKLGLAPGSLVTALVKAPWIIIVKDEDLDKTSARNRFRAKITKIVAGKIVAEVIASMEDGTELCTLITIPSIKNLDLKEGDHAWFLFKAFSVILNVD
jgi:molybdate transport system regulatory protein